MMRTAAIAPGSSAPYVVPGDDELLRAVRYGDKTAVTIFIQRFNPRLYRVARGVLGNDSDAQDALQESWIRIISNIDHFSEGSVIAWLTRITLNESIRLFSQRKRQDTYRDFRKEPGIVEDISHAPRTDEPEKASELAELSRILNLKIDSLPIHFRTVLVLRDIQGHSIEETADLLGIQAATVKTRLHRARKHLKVHINVLLRRDGLTPYEFGGHRCMHVTSCVLNRFYGVSDSAPKGMLFRISALMRQ